MFPINETGVATLHCKQHWHCELFHVMRTDGVELFFSTLDGKLEYDGEIYLPAPGERRDAEASGALAAGDTELVGALSVGKIEAVDIELGLYDDALIIQRTVDWRRKKLYMEQHWFIEEMNHDGLRWQATLLTLSRQLRQHHGPAYHGICDATLGDARCRATVPTYTATVTSVTDSQLEWEFSDVTINVDDNWFALGSCRWLTGNNKNTSNRIYSSLNLGSPDGKIALATPTRYSIVVGDTCTLRPGCDGRAVTCLVKFANLLNHRGNERQKNSKALIASRGTVS